MCILRTKKKWKRKHVKPHLDYEHLENAILMGSCRLSLHWEFAAIPWEPDPSSQQSGLLHTWSACWCSGTQMPRVPATVATCTVRAFDVPLLAGRPTFPNSLKQRGIHAAFLRTPKHHGLPDSNLSVVPWWVHQAWRIPTSLPTGFKDSDISSLSTSQICSFAFPCFPASIFAVVTTNPSGLLPFHWLLCLLLLLFPHKLPMMVFYFPVSTTFTRKFRNYRCKEQILTLFWYQN